MYQKFTIADHQTAVISIKGQLQGLLQPGEYSFWFEPRRTVEVYDMRQSMLHIPGQEVILGDRTSLKINLAVTYKIADPLTVHREITPADLTPHLTQLAQLRLRDTLASVTLDDVLEKRDSLNKQLTKDLEAEYGKVGVKLLEVRIKDVILPAELRSAYTESLSAQLKAKAQLEQARGQSAALRNLANTADLLEKHPQLVQLLTLQKKDSNLNLYFEQTIPGKKDQIKK